MDARIERVVAEARRRGRRRGALVWLAIVAAALVVGVALAAVPWDGTGTVLAVGAVCSLLVCGGIFVVWLRVLGNEDP